LDEPDLKLTHLGYTLQSMLHVKVFLFSPIQENTYVIYNDDNQCVIIDPGCYGTTEQDTLTCFIEDHRLKPVQLVNTHGHLDHVFGLDFVARRYGLIPHIHAKEKAVLDFAPAAGLMWNMPFDAWQGEVRYLDAGEKVCLGEACLDILFTPGHSPGSISFYAPDEGFVIAGDVLFRESVGRTDLPGGDAAVLSRSIREVLYTLPDSTRVLSGHGPETTIGWEKQHNPFVRA
jgi:glyoxylase-like metal-dependent hydrolase (beta-lactamase superfamily II)